jgi:tetratricopeptide (TPR) repeat protein
MPDDLVEAGRRALEAGDWDAARDAFERAGESAETLAGLSEAVRYQGDHERAIELKERAFALYRRDGKRAEAAELARWLAFLHGAVHGDFAVANGWMARAERLLDDVEECAAHGWHTLDRAPFSDDPSERERLARAALAIARRFGDPMPSDTLGIVLQAFAFGLVIVAALVTPPPVRAAAANAD